jgi:predicted nucleic acid-binding Zn ribbon protein
MTCKACGRDVPLVDRTCCEECFEEGPFTRASRLAKRERMFAWLPIRLSVYPPRRVWLRHVERITQSAWGRDEVYYADPR